MPRAKAVVGAVGTSISSPFCAKSKKSQPLGMTKERAVPLARLKPRSLSFSVPLDGCPMAPNFLLGPIASTKLHAPFLKERRTRGLVQGSVQEIRGVCTGVAGALHGLNEMGRSPFRCCLSRAPKPNNEKNITRRPERCEAEPFVEMFFRRVQRWWRIPRFSSTPLIQSLRDVSLAKHGYSSILLIYALPRFETDTSQGKVLDTRRPLNYKAK